MPKECSICKNKECYVVFITISGTICDDCYTSNREKYEEEFKKIKKKIREIALQQNYETPQSS